MTQTSIETVQLRTLSKRNAKTFTTVGLIALFIALILFIFAKHLIGLGMLCFIFGAIFTVLGCAKWIQPEVSIELRQQGLVYHHHRGAIYLEWDNIQRVGVPLSIQSIDSQAFPYVGVRLKQLAPLIDDIPTRLATGLLREQRALMMSSLTLDGELADLERYLSSEFSEVIIEDKRYTGVQAMFARRCQQLNTQLGYHVYIPIDCLDREPREFISLLKDYKQQAEETASRGC
ncbi:DUF2982 domain-containing protein [Shewanella sp. AS1]|uniref:DUF2982 domain-containing protein n=1 Tax=Shewanella sp. AS1 TaxID=2907626 RepID=UPI001F27CCEE|nr:DUF2982 domain-containing protein [Shewanella sp. AS1]MCE9680083.1 DUF2982 domain-containing protein [Shewanella sp. AS1]